MFQSSATGRVTRSWRQLTGRRSCHGVRRLDVAQHGGSRRRTHFSNRKAPDRARAGAARFVRAEHKRFVCITTPKYVVSRSSGEEPRTGQAQSGRWRSPRRPRVASVSGEQTDGQSAKLRAGDVPCRQRPVVVVSKRPDDPDARSAFHRSNNAGLSLTGSTSSSLADHSGTVSIRPKPAHFLS